MYGLLNFQNLLLMPFLAQRVSSINSVSAICESTEADIDEVAHAIGMDSELDQAELPLDLVVVAFQKDILNLVYIAKSYGLDEVAEYWNQVVEINTYQRKDARTFKKY